MAEEEKIISHAKKAIQVVGDKKKSWGERAKEFLYEIIIIIIAVSITLWFHNWNDRRHDKEVEKNFLTGIRDNLERDTAALNYCIQFMNIPIAYYDSVLAQVHSRNINAGYIDSNSAQLINDLYFTADNGLFESFKSAGKLGLVENQKLLTEITNIYASQIPFVEAAERHTFQTRDQDYSQYIGSKYGIDSNWNSTISSHLNDPAVLFHIQKYDIFLKEMNRHRDQLINEISTVLKDLDKELKEKFEIKTEKSN